jgi:hypothetical protein
MVDEHQSFDSLSKLSFLGQDTSNPAASHQRFVRIQGRKCGGRQLSFATFATSGLFAVRSFSFAVQSIHQHSILEQQLIQQITFVQMQVRLRRTRRIASRTVHADGEEVQGHGSPVDRHTPFAVGGTTAARLVASMQQGRSRQKHYTSLLLAFHVHNLGFRPRTRRFGPYMNAMSERLSCSLFVRQSTISIFKFTQSLFEQKVVVVEGRRRIIQFVGDFERRSRNRVRSGRR